MDKVNKQEVIGNAIVKKIVDKQELATVLEYVYEEAYKQGRIEAIADEY